MDSGGTMLMQGHPGEASAHHWSHRQRHTQEKHTKNNEGAHARLRHDSLPHDPRNWSRTDVTTWLHSLSRRHSFPVPPGDRFPMNGKGLCLMTVDMYLQRVPSNGKLLYRDFQLRLARAMHL